MTDPCPGSKWISWTLYLYVLLPFGTVTILRDLRPVMFQDLCPYVRPGSGVRVLWFNEYLVSISDQGPIFVF